MEEGCSPGVLRPKRRLKVAWHIVILPLRFGMVWAFLVHSNSTLVSAVEAGINCDRSGVPAGHDTIRIGLLGTLSENQHGIQPPSPGSPALEPSWQCVHVGGSLSAITAGSKGFLVSGFESCPGRNFSEVASVDRASCGRRMEESDRRSDLTPPCPPVSRQPWSASPVVTACRLHFANRWAAAKQKGGYFARRLAEPAQTR
jgi:hypothetical protein